MTKAEHYYNRQYHKHLRSYSAPTVTQILLNGKWMWPEDAAKHRADKDLKIWKSQSRKLDICCEGLATCLNRPARECLDPGRDVISVGANYKDPGYGSHARLGGNVIKFCPFCGKELVILPYIDELLEEKIKVPVKYVSMYRDGGTRVYEDIHGRRYYTTSSVPDAVFDEYPYGRNTPKRLEGIILVEVDSFSQPGSDGS